MGHFSPLLPLHHCVVWARAWTSRSMIDTSQTHSFTLIGCVDSRSKFMQTTVHWAEPQTADLYLILLSDDNDIFSKYNKNIVTDNCLNYNYDVLVLYYLSNQVPNWFEKTWSTIWSTPWKKSHMSIMCQRSPVGYFIPTHLPVHVVDLFV